MKESLVGKTIKSDYGDISVGQVIASGGQGTVYSVVINRKMYALKWYHKASTTNSLMQGIQDLIDIQDKSDSFIWPKCIVKDGKRFGYLMEILPPEMRSLTDWVLRRFDMEIMQLITACFHLVDSFHSLHSKGFSYQDISLQNIFMDPKTGDIAIIDNDNVITNGRSASGILGTMEFMAPELLVGTKHIPDSDTDRYSLAVLLFHLLLVGHPFDGLMEQKIRCKDIPAKVKLYGSEPVFVFDPDNQSNRPVKGVHDGVIALWNMYPDFIQDLFIQSFTVGINAPSKRPRESEWRRAFEQFQMMIYKCPHCGNSEIIYNKNHMHRYGKLSNCISCHRDPLVPRLKINHFIIALHDGRSIYLSHVDGMSQYRNDRKITTFLWDKRHLSIRNHSNIPIVVNNVTTATTILRNEECEVTNGATISINGHIGTVRF